MTPLPLHSRPKVRTPIGLTIVLAGLIVLTACSGSESEPSETIPPRITPTTAVTTTTANVTTTTDALASMSAEAATYLQDALVHMRHLSINRESVDWEQLEDSAHEAAGGAQTAQATYGAVRLALRLLNDDHSVLFTPAEAESFTHGAAQFATPVVEETSDSLGYVSIGRYLGDLGEQADAYATELSERISTVDGGVCGWLVDLRVATGGNMWPMIGGLSPLLDQGIIGAFTYPDGAVETWEVLGEAVNWAGTPVVNLGHPQGGSDVRSPVAVMIGSLTGSSGEAVAVAFHGQSNVRFFGQPTAGLTTSNEPVELSDGALMILTMSNFTDRHGTQYGQNIPVVPDVEIAPRTDPQASAIEWLRAHPACTS